MLVAREWLDSLGQCCCSHHTQPTIEMLCGVRVRRQLFLCKITHTHHTHHTYAHALFKCNRAPNHPPISLTFVPLLLEMRGRLDLLSHNAHRHPPQSLVTNASTARACLFSQQRFALAAVRASCQSSRAAQCAPSSDRTWRLAHAERTLCMRQALEDNLVVSCIKHSVCLSPSGRTQLSSVWSVGKCRCAHSAHSHTCLLHTYIHTHARTAVSEQGACGRVACGLAR